MIREKLMDNSLHKFASKIFPANASYVTLIKFEIKTRILFKRNIYIFIRCKAIHTFCKAYYLLQQQKLLIPKLV